MIKKWLIGITSVAFVSLGGMAAVTADHEEGTINCSNFETGEEVYEFWTSHGYHSENDPERLDGDSDGVPCESLTSSMESEFLAYEADQQSTSEEETTEEEATEEEATEEEATEEDATDEEAIEEAATEEAATEEEADEDSANESAADSEESSDEGDALPATATSYPMMILLSLLTAGASAFILIRRKVAQA
ncbi:excalibur calcium-binding domain-containing protein [Salipaludibacillus aurantiacus]|uniref:Excalibur calcium-binding domain-containing protein n=1 Tax=Salipaludibacillus aurantiacus TaxID=1601833 RepID=A0A1H9W2W6_9BACI|nr:excalibur calcium-binding domain-containing protein [Salipaludibacillus aurantiacus]SES28101.1 Excalibur calcium-binding domain-containing protein [Salipaludibacillus aurantiacus]